MKLDTYNFTEPGRDGSLLMIIAAAYNGRVFLVDVATYPGFSTESFEIAKVA